MPRELVLAKDTTNTLDSPAATLHSFQVDDATGQFAAGEATSADGDDSRGRPGGGNIPTKLWHVFRAIVRDLHGVYPDVVILLSLMHDL